MYLLKKSRTGDTSSWRISPHTFISFLVSDVLSNETFSAYFDQKTANDLKAGNDLMNAIVSHKAFRPHEMYGLLSPLAGEVSENDLELLYLYYAGIKNNNLPARMTIPEFIDFLHDEILPRTVCGTF